MLMFLLELEIGEKCQCIVEMYDRSVTIKVCCIYTSSYINLVTHPQDPDPYAVTPSHTFTFDHAYSMTTLQETVYTDLGVPILESALNGYNGTIFAYGQTGSGKTHSITGIKTLLQSSDSSYCYFCK